jgi:hypothetical protein
MKIARHEQHVHSKRYVCNLNLQQLSSKIVYSFKVVIALRSLQREDMDIFCGRPQ